MELLKMLLRVAPLAALTGAMACYAPAGQASSCGNPPQAGTVHNATPASPNMPGAPGGTGGAGGAGSPTAPNPPPPPTTTAGNPGGRPGVECGAGSLPRCTGCMTNAPQFSPMPPIPYCPPGVLGYGG